MLTFFLVKLIFNEKRLFLFETVFFLDETYLRKKGFFCLLTFFLVRLIINEKGFLFELDFFLVRHNIIKWEKGKSKQETCSQNFSRCLYFLSSKNRQFTFLRRGVLRDESLNMSKLSTFDSLSLSISSYGLKTFSHRPKVLFDFCEKRWKMTKIKFLERGFLRDVLLHIGENFQNDIRDIFNFLIWSKTPFLTFGTQKTRKIKFLERRVLWDEFLHM